MCKELTLVFLPFAVPYQVQAAAAALFPFAVACRPGQGAVARGRPFVAPAFLSQVLGPREGPQVL